ncbi:MAG TPA: MBL fold metallo-hydrolase [Allosphingosinicella sp.]|nr:MBL fold metallo-hydrolase [Allosphingosinicella sp.]
MKVCILGCGTSTGVPRIGNDWGRCDPDEPKNRRRRVSILVSAANRRILVDTTPDLRDQLNDADVATVDAIIWTHEHADHAHGIDDVRQLFHNKGEAVPGYAAARTLRSLTSRFDYVFEGKWGYPATVSAQTLLEDTEIAGIRVQAVEQPHGSITSTGLLFTHNGRSIGYSTDFNDLTGDMATLFQGADLWIVDALRHHPHPTHNHLERTLFYIERLRPRRALLTHMDNSMDYRSLLRELPPHVEPAYDGMEIEL